MNKYFNSLLKIMWVVLPFSIAVSCTDAWDTHYSTNQNVLQNKSKTLAEKISEYGTETDLFVQTLKNTMFVKGSKTIMSYYDYLSTDQVFTVWVPLESSISQEDWAEYTNPNKTLEEHIKVGQRFLNNHIARYSYSIGYEESKIRMLSKKRYDSLTEDGATFAGVSYKTKNIPCINGLIHLLDGTITYRPTIYEYITEEESYKDNLGQFFLKYTIDEIDENRSIVSGIDENGEPIRYLTDQYIASAEVIHGDGKGLDNGERTNKLKDEIKKSGFSYKQVWGVYDGDSEKSFMIFPMKAKDGEIELVDFDELVDFGKKLVGDYTQYSVHVHKPNTGSGEVTNDNYKGEHDDLFINTRPSTQSDGYSTSTVNPKKPSSLDHSFSTDFVDGETHHKLKTDHLFNESDFESIYRESI